MKPSLKQPMTKRHLFTTLENKSILILFTLQQNPPVSSYFFPSYSSYIMLQIDLGTHQHLNNIQLVNFVKKGGNMLIAVTPEPSDSIRALASEFNIELESEKVFDHSQFIEKDQSLIATSNIVGPASIVDKKQLKAPVLFSGTGLTVSDSPLSTAILNAESSAFTADEYQPRADTSHPVSLVGALQARNSARVTFVGSLDMFSNKLMSSAANLHSGQS